MCHCLWYEFFYDNFCIYLVAYLYSIELSQPIMPTSTFSYTNATCALLFVKCGEPFSIRDETSTLASSFRLRFKGEHYDQTVIESWTLCECPLLETLYLFMYFDNISNINLNYFSCSCMVNLGRSDVINRGILHSISDLVWHLY